MFVHRPVYGPLRAFVLLSALLFAAGCSNGQLPSGAPLSPLAPLAAMPASVPHPAHPDHRKSWMSPTAKSTKYLLYVSDGTAGDVNVYDYQNGEQVGTLTGFDGPAGQCVDAKGDVYIANIYDNGEIVEYAHGGSSPLKTFTTDGYALGCAVDGKGDLAATNSEAFNESNDAGNVCVWKHGKGSPTCYANGLYCTLLWPAGYDGNGNLIAIGYAYDYGSTEVCGVPSGGTSMIKLSFNEPLDYFYGGGAMWDGRHITLSNWESEIQYEPAIYQVTLSGSTLTEVGETVLSDALCDNKVDVPLPFIVGKKNTPVNREQGKTVIGTNTECTGSGTGVGFWRYPKGGNPYRNDQFGSASGGESVSIAR